MDCECTRGDGSPCPNAARYRINLNGSVNKRYCCNVHLNRVLRQLIAFDSPRLIQVATRA